MARFRMVDKEKAPRPAKQSGRLAARMREFNTYVEQAANSKDKVGELMPEEGETTRGISLRISRAARRLNKNADTWVGKDGAVYFEIKN